MRPFVALLVSIVAVAAVVASAPAGAEPPRGVPWGYALESAYVPQGSNATLIVWGPEGGDFNVSVYVQPFNATAPAYTYAFNLTVNSTVPYNATSVVYKNVSIPTSYLIGTVELCVTNMFGTVLGCPRVSIESGNYTAIENQIAWMNLNWTILAGREVSLFYAVQNVQTNVDAAFWTSVALWASCIFAIVFTRTRVADRNIGRTVIGAFRKTFYGPRHVEFEDGLARRIEHVVPVAERIYRGKPFPKCLTCRILQTETEIRNHLFSQHAISRPLIGYDYEVVRSAVKNVASRRGAREEVDMSVLARRLDMVGADFSLDSEGGRA